MTLQATKPISLTDIQDEFAAPAGTPLSAFLRGGVWVPDSSGNAGVPTSKPIALTDLLGASAVSLNLTSATVSDTQLAGDAVVELRFDSNGSFTKFGNVGGGTPVDEWISSHPDVGVGAAYETEMVVQSGDGPNSGSAVGVFLDLAVQRSWVLTRTQAAPGSFSGVWRVTVREIADTGNAVTADFDVTAEAI